MVHEDFPSVQENKLLLAWFVHHDTMLSRNPSTGQLEPHPKLVSLPIGTKFKLGYHLKSAIHSKRTTISNPIFMYTIILSTSHTARSSVAFYLIGAVSSFHVHDVFCQARRNLGRNHGLCT